jgi:hypothetical protein
MRVRTADAARRSALVAIVAVLVAGARPSAQFEKTISSTFDGWTHLADGSYELVFGYMNRNADEIDVPLGSANQLDPAPADHGQPTNFLPGRQRAAFRIHVPADFKGKYVWTLTYAGVTQTATASIDQNYSLDVGDPEPPTVKAPADLTARVDQPVKLTPVVGAAPRPPVPQNADVVARRSAGAPIAVWWSKFRGPGTITFGDGPKAAVAGPTPRNREQPLGAFRVACANPPAADCGTTTARFSAPGTYLIRIVAAERSASNALLKVVVTP